MFETNTILDVFKKLGVYVLGIALAITGALGLAGAIELSTIISGSVFVIGLIMVLIVHEYLSGPI